MEETAKAGKEHKEKARKEMQPLLGELTEKSVKNFVNAEKSLLDLAMKAGKGREEGRKASRHRAAKREKAGTHEAVAAVA